MLLKVAPDPRGIVPDVDAEATQGLGRPDSRKHQQFGRCQAASREDDLFARADVLHSAALAILDACGSLVIERYSVRDRLRAHVESLPRSHSVQVFPG